MTVTDYKTLFRNKSSITCSGCFTSNCTICIWYSGGLNDSGFVCSEYTAKTRHKNQHTDRPTYLNYEVHSDFETFYKNSLTSSMGSSSSCGRQGASTPMRNGVGEQLMSSMLAGNTGTNVCCHVNGYSSASTAWPHRDNTLQ